MQQKALHSSIYMQVQESYIKVTAEFINMQFQAWQMGRQQNLKTA
jgi:hypothetical protein